MTQDHALAAETATPEPGVYHRTPMEEYHAWDAASNSRLTALMRSPAHCRAAMDQEFEDTDALRLGRAAHCSILEPDQWLERYVEQQQCAAPTKAGKRCSKTGTVPLASGSQLCGTHAPMWDDERDTREILNASDWNACFAMRHAVRSIHRALAVLLEPSGVELSLVWDDQGSGVRCKARLDLTSTEFGGTLVDLKTTRDASLKDFEKSIFNYGYHRQGALYLEAAAAHGIEARHYAIIAVESSPPYAVGLYRLTEGAIEAGADQLRPLLATYAECRESGNWPGYSEEWQNIGLPDWAWKQVGAHD